MIERLLPTALLRRFMSPLGKEIEALFDEGQGEWKRSEHTVWQPEAGVCLWTGNGYPFFRLYWVRNGDVSMKEDEVENLLNRADRCVIWRSYRAALKYTLKLREKERKETIANLAKMAYMKGDSNE